MWKIQLGNVVDLQNISATISLKSAVHPMEYIHTVHNVLGFDVVRYWVYPYPSGLLHWHWGNLMIVPVPVKQP